MAVKNERRRAKVLIAIRPCGGEPERKRRVDAEIVGPFAVHQTHDIVPTNASDHTLTHRPTGYAVLVDITKDIALALAHRLLEPPLSAEWWNAAATVDQWLDESRRPLMWVANERVKAARTLAIED